MGGAVGARSALLFPCRKATVFQNGGMSKEAGKRLPIRAQEAGEIRLDGEAEGRKEAELRREVGGEDARSMRGRRGVPMACCFGW